jgi:hypothetical protein
VQVVEVDVRPAARAGEAPCDMAFTWLDVGYLVDAAGRWHAREGAPATPDDPPPPACLLDLSARCD